MREGVFRKRGPGSSQRKLCLPSSQRVKRSQPAQGRVSSLRVTAEAKSRGRIGLSASESLAAVCFCGFEPSAVVAYFPVFNLTGTLPDRCLHNVLDDVHTAPCDRQSPQSLPQSSAASSLARLPPTQSKWAVLRAISHSSPFLVLCPLLLGEPFSRDAAQSPSTLPQGKWHLPLCS